MGWSPRLFTPACEQDDEKIFNAGKDKVTQGIDEKNGSYDIYRQGARELKRVAHLPEARRWLTDLYVVANVPIVKQAPAILYGMRKDPSTFAANTVLREYSYNRCLRHEKNRAAVLEYLAANHKSMTDTAAEALAIAADERPSSLSRPFKV